MVRKGSFLLLLLLLAAVACRAEATSVVEPVNISTAEASATKLTPVETTSPLSLPGTPTAVADGYQVENTPPATTPTPGPTLPTVDLPLLPLLRQAEDGLSIGEPLPGGVEDPFAAAVFRLTADLPAAPETAVVEHHSFAPLNEVQARQVADQFGFTGPLYVQQVPPEFAPPDGQESPTVYAAFSGQSVLNLSDSGVVYEDRGIFIDYSHRPVFARAAPRLEEQLHAWKMLDFPYQINELATGDLVISRLIDRLPVEQNEFNFVQNEAGEIGSFAYRPLRQSEVLGRYPLQTADEAWAQLQTSGGRANGRYQMFMPLDPADDPFANFVNPRSWQPSVAPGQELHVYITPAVYEATDGSGLRLVHGNFTLTGDAADLADIASHLSDVLHIWGITGVEAGTPTLEVAGWEPIEIVQYESLEGRIVLAGEDTLLQTAGGETFALAAPPADLPGGLDVHLSVAGRRDSGSNYPILDWISITEKITYPDIPLMPFEETVEAIAEVTIESAELLYFTLYETVDVPHVNTSLIYLPVWKFLGSSDQGHQVTFWLPAVSTKYFQSSAHGDTFSSGSINGWVWQDLCNPGGDEASETAVSDAGCIDSATVLDAHHANGILEAHEPPLAGVVVRLGVGACPSTGLAEITTIATDLSYTFSELPANTYCVSIDPSEKPNASLLNQGSWTFPEVTGGTIGRTLSLAAGQNLFDINFGWDFQTTE